MTVITRKQLFDAFRQLAAEFDQARARVSARERAVDGALAGLRAELARSAGKLDVVFKGDHPVLQAFQGYTDQIHGVQEEWGQRVEQYERGTAFRELLGDSFLIYVYGKVNAGKSSLGNYVATGKEKPSKADIEALAGQGVRFAWQEAYDGAVSEGLLEQGFPVDRQECTNAIQYFTLPGLSWIDSPGLHSKNPANGDLARRYAESADLILYLMNADNPARQSDMREIEALLVMGKPFFILLTRSDEEKFHLDADGEPYYITVMMSAQDRQSQVEYVHEQLNQLLSEEEARKALVKAETLPVSVRVAEQAARAKDSGSLEDSGLPSLFAVMTQLAQRDSVQIKKNTPLNNLDKFTQDLLRATARLRLGLDEIGQATVRFKQDVDGGREGLIGSLKLSMYTTLSQSMGDFDGDTRALVRQVRERLEQDIRRQVGGQLERQFQELDRAVADALDFTDASDLPGFEQRFATGSYSNGGQMKAIGAALLGIAGAAGGFVFGGPGGAMAGSTIGSLVGGVVGRVFANTTEYNIPNGDNRDEIEAEAQEAFSRDIEKAVDQQYVVPALIACAAVEQRLEQSRKALENFAAVLTAPSAQGAEAHELA